MLTIYSASMCSVRNVKTVLKWKSRDGNKRIEGAYKIVCWKNRIAENKSFFPTPQSSDSAKTNSAAEKCELVDVISSMCATDIPPFSIVDGPGFRKLVQKLISIGANQGNISGDDVVLVLELCLAM